MTTLAGDLYLLVAAYGLAVAVSYAGLPVLGQGAFVAVGAFGTAQLAAHGLPLGVAVVVAVAGAGAAGYAVAFAGARLAGGPLALATWALSWLVYSALVVFPSLGGGAAGLTRATPARLVSPSLGVAVTLTPGAHVAIAGVAAVVLAVALRETPRTAWGLDLAALRTGAVVADSLGVPVQRRRRAVLAAAAAVGAFAGAGTAVLQGVVAPADYSPLLSLQLFVAVLVGGAASWWGPALGVAVLAALPSMADGLAHAAGIDPLRARSALTAVLLVAVVAARSVLRRQPLRWWPQRRRPRTATAAGSAAGAGASPLLELCGVQVRFGAVQALAGVDLSLRAGEVHALVGPNGSGKSTALRVAAGAMAADGGAVVVAGSVVTTRGAPARVATGIARTLQRTAMLGDLDAWTQVEIGARAQDPLVHQGLRELLRTPRARAAALARASRSAAALDVVGLRHRAQVATSQLDSADQRLVQIARVVATGARGLLLDEPAAGMSAPQRRHLAAVLRALADRGHGVLLVEHDMGLVSRVADRVTVLAEGRVLASGAPSAVRADPAVARAYLGT